MADNDFADAWELLDVQPPRTIQDLFKRQLDYIASETQKELETKFVEHHNTTLDATSLSLIVTQGVSTFMKKWEETWKIYNLLGLLNIILESQGLSPKELKDFLRALPDSLIRRVIKTSTSTITGVQVFLAIENLYRTQVLKEDYQIKKNSDGRVFASILHGSQMFSIFLDDIFEGLPAL